MGADFLAHFKPSVDLANLRLVDNSTSLMVIGSLSKSKPDPHSHRRRDIPKTAITTLFSLYEFIILPFGLRNAAQSRIYFVMSSWQKKCSWHWERPRTLYLDPTGLGICVGRNPEKHRPRMLHPGETFQLLQNHVPTPRKLESVKDSPSPQKQRHRHRQKLETHFADLLAKCLMFWNKLSPEQKSFLPCSS